MREGEGERRRGRGRGDLTELAPDALRGDLAYEVRQASRLEFLRQRCRARKHLQRRALRACVCLASGERARRDPAGRKGDSCSNGRAGAASCAARLRCTAHTLRLSDSSYPPLWAGGGRDGLGSVAAGGGGGGAGKQEGAVGKRTGNMARKRGRRDSRAPRGRKTPPPILTSWFPGRRNSGSSASRCRSGRHNAPRKQSSTAAPVGQKRYMAARSPRSTSGSACRGETRWLLAHTARVERCGAEEGGKEGATRDRDALARWLHLGGSCEGRENERCVSGGG